MEEHPHRSRERGIGWRVFRGKHGKGITFEIQIKKISNNRKGLGGGGGEEIGRRRRTTTTTKTMTMIMTRGTDFFRKSSLAISRETLDLESARHPLVLSRMCAHIESRSEIKLF